MMNEVGAQEELQCRMSPEEEDLISRLHNLLGDRWALIAGRIPGRTAEEVEMYWKWRMNCSNSRTEAANRGKYGPQEPQILKPVFSRLQSPRGWAKSKNGYSYKSHGSKSRDG